MKKSELIALDKHLTEWEPKTATYEQIIAFIRSKEPRTVDINGKLDATSSLIWRIQQTESEENYRLGFKNNTFLETAGAIFMTIFFVGGLLGSLIMPFVHSSHRECETYGECVRG